MNAAYRDLLLEVCDWRAERKARELAFYRAALAVGELTVVQGHEHTTRKCRCDICLAVQDAGGKKFWFHGKGGGFWWFHPCEKCLTEMTSVEVHASTIAPIPQTVTS